MCGIICYIGKKEAVPLLLEGLRRLEYRGYDSAGIALVNAADLVVTKESGKLLNLANKGVASLPGTCGIGHTRWATHGPPTAKNAHPHQDCTKKFAVVHNGIIENYLSLKTLLESRGHAFSSETDSEVLSHLIEECYKGDLASAVSEALLLVEGTFGLAVLHAGEQKIVLARRGSPVILGITDHGLLAASDAAALVSHTKKVVYLSDHDILEMNPEGYSLARNGKILSPRIDSLQMDLEQVEKGSYAHFMEKEIHEQPEVCRNILRGRLNDNKVTISLHGDVSAIKRFLLVACGTSYHACLLGKQILEHALGIPCEVCQAGEFLYSKPLFLKGDTMIAVSQSGETADTLHAIRLAKSAHVPSIGIVNVVGSTIAREVDSGVYLHAGPELSVASTKAFTAQVITFHLVAQYLRQAKLLPLDNDVLIALKNALPVLLQKILSQKEQLLGIAKGFLDHEHILYLGRNSLYPVALEGALKMKEITYIHAEGYPSSEIKHGPLALVSKGMPVICLVQSGELYQKDLSTIQEVKARGAKVIVIASEDCPGMQGISNDCILLPSHDKVLTPVLASVVLQMLAYYTAREKGLDVDRPRNLAKSVTVE